VSDSATTLSYRHRVSVGGSRRPWLFRPARAVPEHRRGR